MSFTKLNDNKMSWVKRRKSPNPLKFSLKHVKPTNSQALKSVNRKKTIKIVNPISKRRIIFGGVTHLKLIKEHILGEDGKDLKEKTHDLIKEPILGGKDLKEKTYDLNKITGVLMGSFLGDALGLPYERQIYKKSKHMKYTGKLEHYMIGFNRFKKKYWRTALGQISDDSEMIITILNTLIINKGVYKKDDMIMAYIKWANSKNNKFMGRTTRDLFLGIKTLSGYYKHYQKKYSDEKKKESQQSNGALMRCSILSLLSNSDAKTDCIITNPSSICIEIELIYLECVRYGMANKTKTDIYNMCKKKVKSNIVKKAIEQAINGEKRDVTVKGSFGWVVHAFFCALYALFNFENFYDGIGAVILMGGDTDTNACISGGLSGGFYGFDKINGENKKNMDILLENRVLSGEGDIIRPKEYTLDNIKDKIQMLVNYLK